MNIDDNDGFYLISFSDSWEEHAILSSMDSYADDIKQDIIKNKGNPEQKASYEIEKRKNNVVRLECKSCSEYFSEKTDFDIHMRAHETRRLYKWRKNFAKQFSLESHSRIDFMKSLYKCGICKKGFQTIRILEEHLKIHKRKKVNKSNIPKKQIFQALLHVQTEARYVCDICGELFSKQCFLQDHLLIHSVKKSVKCKDGFILLKRYGMVERKPFDKCYICEKTFLCKENLRRHSRIHTDQELLKYKIWHNQSSSGYDRTVAFS